MIINKLKEIINGQAKTIKELDGQLNFFQTKSSAMSGWCKDYKERSEQLEKENGELRKSEFKKTNKQREEIQMTLHRSRENAPTTFEFQKIEREDLEKKLGDASYRTRLSYRNRLKLKKIF